MSNFKNKNSGNTTHDHMSSERHIVSVDQHRKQFEKCQFPVYAVPVATRAFPGAGFKEREAPANESRIEQRNRARDEDKVISGMLHYVRITGGSSSFKEWVRRSLSHDDASTQCKKGAVARELAYDLAKLFYWKEEDMRDYSLREVASGAKYIQRYKLDIEFSEYIHR